MNKINSHIFRGRRYKIENRSVHPDIKRCDPNTIATCDGPPSQTGKTITIDPEATGLSLLKVAIDEGIHACVWDFDNTAVNEMSESISMFLWRLGFRETTMVNGVPVLKPTESDR